MLEVWSLPVIKDGTEMQEYNDKHDAVFTT